VVKLNASIEVLVDLAPFPGTDVCCGGIEGDLLDPVVVGAASFASSTTPSMVSASPIEPPARGDVEDWGHVVAPEYS
jgi:hypothetical protein